MKKLFCLFFAFIMVLSFSSCSSLIAPEVEPWVGPFTEFGDIRPEINLNGKKYYYGEYLKTGYIPEGYSEAGYSVFVGDSEPLNDLEIKSGTEISGKVFSGNETNATVYILLDSPEWAKGGSFCFFCEEMITELNRAGWDSLVAYGGKLYELSFHKGRDFGFEELPEGFVFAGKLDYIGIDNLPQKDFETNCKNDAFDKSVDGKEVFINPDDLSEIYVSTLYYWAEGSYTVYTKCVLSE